MHLDIERQHMESTNIYRTKDAYGKNNQYGKLKATWKGYQKVKRLWNGSKA